MLQILILVLLKLYVVAGIASSAPRLLVLGLGNVGRAVLHEADRCGFFDDRIQGTSRSLADSTETILFTPDSVGSVLPKCTHVLVTIPPPRQDDPTFNAVVDQLTAKLPPGAWLGFVSTSGVYGNHNGGWVTEDSLLHCSDDSPTFRYIESENFWRELSQHCGWICRVFRCAGLYGPDRSALHTLWKKRIIKVSPAAGLTNRIHETDVARAIVASMVKSFRQPTEEFRVYNLSDDQPETRAVVMKHAAELLRSIDVDVAVEESDASNLTLSTRSSRRDTDIKRVSNGRMKHELISELSYPTYSEGLTAIFEDSASPWQRKQ